MLLPALGFFNVFPFRYSFVADHFQYHACIALIALAVAAVTSGTGRLLGHTPGGAPLVAACLLVPLAVLTWNRTLVYRDRQTLHENTLAQNPGAWVAALDLGNMALEQGKYDRAILYDRQGIEALERLVEQTRGAAGFQDTLAGGYLFLGFAQLRMGRANEAESTFRKAARDP